MPAPAYHINTDRTLTNAQSYNQCFSKAVLSGIGDVRAQSNLTLQNHNSGYHESVLTTDGMTLLHESTNSTTTGMLIPPNSASSAGWAGLKGKNFYEENKNTILKIADGFRTDTARTILSAPDGKAAGHSGSGMSLTGQADAHDLLRKAVVKLLFSDPKNTPGLSKRSIACVFGAITIASMAPGELARTVTGTLKDPTASSDWEQRRNEAKFRHDAMMNQLNHTEQTFVRTHAADFLTSTQISAHPPTRTLAPGKATSEARDDTPPPTAPKGTINGRNYDQSFTGSVSLSPPDKVEHWGYYLTEPFRALRR